MIKKAPTYKDIIHPKSLHRAWLAIQKNKGAGGIDKVDIDSYGLRLQSNIDLLHHSLKSYSYNPEPYLKIHIPKNKEEYRQLGLLTIRDKIIQQAIRQAIEPQIDALFFDNSYAYRYNKGATKAIHRLRHDASKLTGGYYISADIKDFFDTIPHHLLFERLKHHIIDEEVLALIKLCTTTGVVNKAYTWTDKKMGIPQGSILSPLLANFYLHPFDQLVLSKTQHYVRYADDFIIMTAEKKLGEDLLKKIEKYIPTTLQLKFKYPPELIPIAQKMLFMGLNIDDKSIQIDPNKKSRIQDKIDFTLKLHQKQWTKKSIELLQGLKNYYGKLLPEYEKIYIDNNIFEKIKSIFEENKITHKKDITLLYTPIPFLSNKFEINKGQQINELYQYFNKHKEAKKLIATEKLIAVKKRQYQQMEAMGMELIVNQYGAFIGNSTKGIQVRLQGKNIKETPSTALNHISVIGNGISISSDAIQYCMQKNIHIDFFDAKGKHYATIQTPENYDASLITKQAAAVYNTIGFTIARQIIDAKITNQFALLKYYGKYHKKVDKDYAIALKSLPEKYAKIKNKIKELQYTDDYAQQCMNIESQAAIIYWDFFQNLIDDDATFTGRERQGAKDLVNAMLNYGYALLYARVWQAVLSAHLHPNISFIHAPQNGKPTLVYDIIELFRAQAVDRVVIALLQRSEPVAIENDLLTEDTRKLLIANVWERINRYELYRGEHIRFVEIIARQCIAIQKYITGESKSFLPYKAKW